MSEVQSIPRTSRPRGKAKTVCAPTATDALPELSQAALAGQAIDIFSTYRLPDALLTNLLDADTAPKQVFQFLGTDYTIPVYVQGIEATSAKEVEDSVENRDAYQNSIAAHAEAHASIGAFSAQMSASYGSEFATASDYSYAYRNFYLSCATLQVNIDDALAYRSQEFVNAINALPEYPEPGNLRPFAEFFERFGFYFSSVVNLGGMLEYSVAVDKNSQQSTTEIATAMKAEYRGLFASGGVSADYASTTSWQKYRENRHVRINMLGGDPVTIAQVAKLAETAPDASSVDAYDRWVASVTTAPAATDFKVQPIWNLAPERRGALTDAFDMLREGLRPTMTIECGVTPGSVPTIILGQPIVPDEPPAYEMGFQVVVLNRENISPSGVVFNRYYSLREVLADYRPYGELWERMVRDVKQRGFNTPKYFLIVATFNWGFNAAPVQQAPEFTSYSFLRSCGGGERLLFWNSHSDPGSSVASYIMSYLLVGIMGVGADTGVEGLADKYPLVPARRQVFFYREHNTKAHSLGDGGSFGAEAAPNLRRVLNVSPRGGILVA
ncbi:MAG TPA: MAC/perforin domain-containing protein [Thermoanaerobaculia bacterium]